MTVSHRGLASVGGMLSPLTRELPAFDSSVADWPQTALFAATRQLGVSTAHGRILAIGHCATIALPEAGLVARVARPGWPAEKLDRELRIARYFHQAGLAVLTPADDVTIRPVATPHGPVTFWPLLRPARTGLDWRWLGRTLRALHDLPVPGDFPSLWDPLGVVEARLAAYARRTDARPDFVAAFSEACGQTRAVLSGIRSASGVRLVHGDSTNVIVTAKGPLLHDFDLAGIGPAEWIS